MPPLVGITADLEDGRYQVSASYPGAVSEAGGVPVILPARADHAAEYVRRCDGLVLSGGDDPIMERWGLATHPEARRVDPARQDFELALLDALEAERDKPVLGICLGMQLMGLHRGGALEQHLPDRLDSADDHWGRRAHHISGELGRGIVHSHHHQALTDPGSLRVVATAPDGVIEAVRADDRPFYLGVQWHAERTEDEKLGLGLIRELVEMASP